MSKKSGQSALAWRSDFATGSPGPRPPAHSCWSLNRPLSSPQLAHHVSQRLGPVSDGTRLVCFLPGGPRFTSCLLQLSACPRPPRIPSRSSLTSSRFPQVGGHPPSPSQSPPRPGLRLKATGLPGNQRSVNLSGVRKERSSSPPSFPETGPPDTDRQAVSFFSFLSSISDPKS